MFIDQKSRVPYFTFADRECGADPQASKEAGYEVPKMMTFILITPHGHKGDPMEFYAEEFIERKGIEAKQGRYEHTWVAEYKAGLAAHKEGNVLPRNGSPLIQWERILLSRRKMLVNRYPTVEDLAAVPDSALGDVGMDGRVLRDMAKADIQAKKDLSPVVKELAEAKEDNRRLSEQMATMQEQMNKLIARMDEPEAPRRGRPRKEESDA